MGRCPHIDSSNWLAIGFGYRFFSVVQRTYVLRVFWWICFLVCCSHCVRCSPLHSGTGTQDRSVDQPSCRWQLHHLSPVAVRTDTISRTAQRIT